ncbi:MAG: hypothetical protein P3C10_08240 [Gemmatimonadota bacterium]|jgi:hypothetical protein|nr:hypothetical protein [Gemmatimonadota bacterium]
MWFVRLRPITVLLAVMLPAVAAPARAQAPAAEPASSPARATLARSTLGVSVRVHGIAGRMNTDIHPGAGGHAATGVGGEVAYGASPRLTLFGGLTRMASTSSTTAVSTDYTIRQGDIGLRWMTHPGARVRPFAEAALAVRRLAFTLGAGNPRDYTAFDGGATAALGVMLFQTDRVSLEGAATYTGGTFSTWKVDGEPQPIAAMASSTLGVRVGARYWFQK